MSYRSSKVSYIAALRIRRFTTLLLVSLLFGASACGYHLQGSSSILPDDVESVAIPIVENDTTLPGLGLQFTEKLRSRFERYGVVRVVEGDSGADATLTAAITQIETLTRDVTGSTDIALEQDLVVSIAAELKRANGQILWRNDRIRVIETFGSTSDVVVTSSPGFSTGGIGSSQLGTLGSREVSRGQQDQALDDLLEEASRIIYVDAVAADF